MLLGKSNVQTVVGGCGLQLEVESDAETLAQSETPGFVDAAAKRRVDHQLHAAAFIEKAFRNHGLFAWAPRPERRDLAGCIR